MSSDVDALTDTLSSLFDDMDVVGIGSINLSNLNATEVNPEHLAAILRATSSMSFSVLGWSDALDVATKALSLNGYDPSDALYGLI